MKKRSRKATGFIVAIDGPSGAGKSTVSRLLSESLGGLLVDTGSMYRAVALFALELGLNHPAGWSALARRLRFGIDQTSSAITVDGMNLGERLRGEQVGAMASDISRYPSVRLILTARQRALSVKLAKTSPVVVEGRDIGTVVFPRAPFKFFVTADPRVRAKRRYTQLHQKGARGISVQTILREINRRDRQDSTRKTAPLRCAPDAVVVDTSKMPIPQVVLFLKTHIEKKLSTS